MSRGLQGAILRGFGARDHTATVIETVYIAPHFVRVRMVSPTLFESVKAEPAAWLRFWFPDPDGSKTEFQRAYTISEADVPASRFAVDVVLHEPAGPASSWARAVEPGTTIAVMSLMGSSRFDVPDAHPAAATRSRWPRRLKAATGRTGTCGRHPRPRRSSMSESGCATSSGSPSPEYTRRPTGARDGRWAPAEATSLTHQREAEWRVFAE
jgi:Siderophore-interacting FAD-binding domain